MSLDVYLTLTGVTKLFSNGIYIRRNGQNEEITREEWDELYPGREPATVEFDEGDEVYSANITHNLGKMADEAMLYMPLWRPDEMGITHAAQLIEPLRLGLGILRRDPERFKKLNPKNGWGDYDGLLGFAERYLQVCETYPDAEVEVSR